MNFNDIDNKQSIICFHILAKKGVTSIYNSPYRPQQTHAGRK